MTSAWAHLLSDADRRRLDRAGFARRAGIGPRSLVLILNGGLIAGAPLEGLLAAAALAGVEIVFANSPWGGESGRASRPEGRVVEHRFPSALFGSVLLAELSAAGVDSLIVAGGPMATAVRATVVEAVSYNLRVAVVGDLVIDDDHDARVVGLFDLDRQYADVMSSQDVIAWLQQRSEECP